MSEKSNPWTFVFAAALLDDAPSGIVPLGRKTPVADIWQVM